MFLASQLYFALKQDVLTQEVVEQETRELSDTICEHGEITETSLTTYLKTIASTGNLYDVSILHEKLCLEPEYRFKSIDEIIDDQNSGYTGPNPYTYREVISNIPEVNDPEPEHLPVNTETNESVMASAINTGASPSHIHTPECYDGHLHNGEPYFYINHAHSSCVRFVSRLHMKYHCNSCNEDVVQLQVANYWDDLRKTVVTSYNAGTFNGKCRNCNSTYLTGVQEIREYGYSCSYVRDENGDGYLDDIPYGVTYTYKTTSPASTLLHTYDNGCYHYHSTQIRDYATHYDDDYQYKQNNSRLLEDLASGNLYNYCKIPRYYALAFDWEYEGSHYTKSTTYRLVVNDDGSIYFQYSSSTEGDRFPLTLTVTQFRNFSLSIRGFFNAYSSENNHSGDDYTSIGEASIILCDEARQEGWSTSCGMDGDANLVCNQIIVSIAPTHPIQTIYSGDAMITTLLIKYRDGSTRTVIGSTNFNTRIVGNNQIATIYYDGKDTGTTTKRFQTTVTISVIARTQVCTNGHTYNKNADGSDPGCPYCRAWLRTLTIAAPTTGYLELYQGTSLESNGVVLLATYLNGRQEFVSTGYAHNLDNIHIGTQTVTIGYKGKYVSLQVKVLRKRRQCTICSRFYELYPDGSDPGCPYCLALIPVFTGNVMKYYTEYTTDEIMKEVNTNGSYSLSKGDEIIIKVDNKNDTLATKTLSFLSIHTSNKIKVWTAAKVRDEK